MSELSVASRMNSLSGKSAERPPEVTAELRKASRDFEAAFLTEALGHMGLDASNGVAGATEFSSMLNRAYAERLVDQGGIGLSENIFRALAARAENA